MSNTAVGQAAIANVNKLKEAGQLAGPDAEKLLASIRSDKVDASHLQLAKEVRIAVLSASLDPKTRISGDVGAASEALPGQLERLKDGEMLNTVKKFIFGDGTRPMPIGDAQAGDRHYPRSGSLPDD